VIAQQKDDFLPFPGLQVGFYLQHPDRLPSVRHRTGRLACFYNPGRIPAPVGPQKSLAVGVEAGQCFRTGKKGEVIASLAVLALVLNHIVGDFYFADGIIALEVGGVVKGAPQGKFDRPKDGKVGCGAAPVGESQFPDFESFSWRDEITRLGFDAMLPRADDGVAQAMAAFVEVQRARIGIQVGNQARGRQRAARLLSGRCTVRPCPAGRCCSGNASNGAGGHRGKGVAAGSVRDQAKIGVATEIVDPGQGSIGPLMTYLRRSSSK
jgi:hypothetical protein